MNHRDTNTNGFSLLALDWVIARSQVQHKVNATISTITALFDNGECLAAEGFAHQQLKFLLADAFNGLLGLPRIRYVYAEPLTFSPGKHGADGANHEDHRQRTGRKKAKVRMSWPATDCLT
ncbi:hypothetical protein [Pseudomonas citronellolis]|uniref:hypothetical protein n=1 Tax=Pseudomonas citronellolis TaxID=53408 RepID=UPI003F503A9D|nr:hypothetical protein [Pseudomonas citronellolis]MCP1656556.1 hypothetical protein [Pseudomonas citronellolis]MCP1723585.1 hypothetical protein [Pseudomonas citronellolis]